MKSNSDNYHSKHNTLVGSSYSEIVTKARKEFNAIRKTTKRQPYIRSKYFHGDKIFITLFWDHLMQKQRSTIVKRLKFYLAALDLLQNTNSQPESNIDPKDKNIILHRFYGLTRNDISFRVQVKQNIRNGRKDFMSVFPVKQK